MTSKIFGSHTSLEFVSILYDDPGGRSQFKDWNRDTACVEVLLFM
jgi:hypothetical protein